MHAILGASDNCIATHPSDMCVALAALDATVHVEGRGGERSNSHSTIFIVCRETRRMSRRVSKRDELITSIQLPPLPFAKNSRYRKVRDRASYAFALVSVAAALEIEDGDDPQRAARAGRRRAQTLAGYEAENVDGRRASDPGDVPPGGRSELADCPGIRP